MKNCFGYIGSAVYVDVPILLKEVKLAYSVAQKEKRFQPIIVISSNAHIVLPSHRKEDAAKEGKQGFGSTKSGVSIAAGAKYRYEGLRICDADEKTLTPHFRDRRADLLRFMADLEELRTYISIQEPTEWYEKFVKLNVQEIVIEGTQGVGLDVNHAPEYPFVSSGSFSPYGLLDGVGFYLEPTNKIAVLKPYFSYFGDQKFYAPFDNEGFRKHAGEYGTTSGRPRKLAWLEAGILRKLARVSRPTEIYLGHMDSLSYFSNDGTKWCFIDDGQTIIEFKEPAFKDGKITKAGHELISWIEDKMEAPVKFIGTGPRPENTIEIYE